MNQEPPRTDKTVAGAEGPGAAAHAVVTFLPDGLRAQVSLGVTLLEAANQAGVYVNQVCGGRQSCGKCRLIVTRGQADSREAGLLTEKERRRGYVLACATQVTGDVTVMVPEESRLGEAQILLGRAERHLTAEQLDLAGQLVHHSQQVLDLDLEHRPLGRGECLEQTI